MFLNFIVDFLEKLLYVGQVPLYVNYGLGESRVAKFANDEAPYNYILSFLMLVAITVVIVLL